MPSIQTIFDNNNNDDYNNANDAVVDNNKDHNHLSLYNHLPIHMNDNNDSNINTFVDHYVYHIPTLPQAEHAKQLLKRIVLEFIPIIKQRKFNIISISELCCCCDGIDFAYNNNNNHTMTPSPQLRMIQNRRTSKRKNTKTKLTKVSNNLWGYNRSTTSSMNGIVMTYHTIHIRLRQTNTNHMQFLSYDDIAGTLAHELAHCVISPHNKEFYKVMDNIIDDHAILMSNKLTKTLSNGMKQPITAFNGNGQRLGSNNNNNRNSASSTLNNNNNDHNSSSSNFFVSLVEAAQKHRQHQISANDNIGSSGSGNSSGYMLGGDDIFTQFMTPKDAAYIAAEARYQKQKLRQRDTQQQQQYHQQQQQRNNNNNNNNNNKNDNLFCQPCVVTTTNDDDDDDNDDSDEEEVDVSIKEKHEEMKNTNVFKGIITQEKQRINNNKVEVIVLDDDDDDDGYINMKVPESKATLTTTTGTYHSLKEDNIILNDTYTTATATSVPSDMNDNDNNSIMIVRQKENHDDSNNTKCTDSSNHSDNQGSALVLPRQPLIEKVFQQSSKFASSLIDQEGMNSDSKPSSMKHFRKDHNNDNDNNDTILLQEKRQRTTGDNKEHHHSNNLHNNNIHMIDTQNVKPHVDVADINNNILNNDSNDTTDNKDHIASSHCIDLSNTSDDDDDDNNINRDNLYDYRSHQRRRHQQYVETNNNNNNNNNKYTDDDQSDIQLAIYQSLHQQQQQQQQLPSPYH